MNEEVSPLHLHPFFFATIILWLIYPHTWSHNQPYAFTHRESSRSSKRCPNYVRADYMKCYSILVYVGPNPARLHFYISMLTLWRENKSYYQNMIQLLLPIPSNKKYKHIYTHVQMWGTQWSDGLMAHLVRCVGRMWVSKWIYIYIIMSGCDKRVGLMAFFPNIGGKQMPGIVIWELSIENVCSWITTLRCSERDGFTHYLFNASPYTSQHISSHPSVIITG